MLEVSAQILPSSEFQTVRASFPLKPGGLGDVYVYIRPRNVIDGRWHEPDCVWGRFGNWVVACIAPCGLHCNYRCSYVCRQHVTATGAGYFECSHIWQLGESPSFQIWEHSAGRGNVCEIRSLRASHLMWKKKSSTWPRLSIWTLIESEYPAFWKSGQHPNTWWPTRWSNRLSSGGVYPFTDGFHVAFLGYRSEHRSGHRLSHQSPKKVNMKSISEGVESKKGIHEIAYSRCIVLRPITRSMTKSVSWPYDLNNYLIGIDPGISSLLINRKNCLFQAPSKPPFKMPLARQSEAWTRFYAPPLIAQLQVPFKALTRLDW